MAGQAVASAGCTDIDERGRVDRSDGVGGTTGRASGGGWACDIKSEGDLAKKAVGRRSAREAVGRTSHAVIGGSEVASRAVDDALTLIQVVRSSAGCAVVGKVDASQALASSAGHLVRNEE